MRNYHKNTNNSTDMTQKQFEEKLDAITNDALIEKANLAISKLCKTYGKGFTMSIPPSIDDTDIILSEIVRRFDLLLESLLVLKPLTEPTNKDCINAIHKQLSDNGFTVINTEIGTKK